MEKGCEENCFYEMVPVTGLKPVDNDEMIEAQKRKTTLLFPTSATQRSFQY